MVEAMSEDADKRKRMRSPAYPYVNLETAIKRAKEFYDREGRNAANLRVAAKHWGYEEKSSAGQQTAAALISFGLMQDDGTGDKRKVQLTPNALRILLDSDPASSAKAEAIKACALAPKIHMELWKKWGKAHPSDLSMKNVLTFEWVPAFNENSVDGFIREYKDTISFAKLGESDTLSVEVIDKGDESGGTPDGQGYSPAIGDYVQWEPNGILQFREPRRIVRLSTDGQFAFVEGSATGLPTGELTKQAQPANAPAVARNSATPAPLKSNMREDVFSLAEGNVTFQWPTPLSAESIADLKDWLKILERKVSRPAPEAAKEGPDGGQE